MLCFKFCCKRQNQQWQKQQRQRFRQTTNFNQNERKSEQAHIPQAPTLLENALYNEWQFQALVTGNRTKNQFHLSYIK